MANEITLNLQLDYSKSGAVLKRTVSMNVTVTGDSLTHGVQSVGTSEEALTISADIGTPGYTFLKNLDATNYIEVGSTTGVYDIRLKAGEIALYRHNSAALYAKANTAACLLEYLVIED